MSKTLRVAKTVACAKHHHSKCNYDDEQPPKHSAVLPPMLYNSSVSKIPRPLLIFTLCVLQVPASPKTMYTGMGAGHNESALACIFLGTFMGRNSNDSNVQMQGFWGVRSMLVVLE